jgi:hypothetical protein
VRPGGATRGKWGILDEKDESGLMSDLELQQGTIDEGRGHLVSSIDYPWAEMDTFVRPPARHAKRAS